MSDLETWKAEMSKLTKQQFSQYLYNIPECIGRLRWKNYAPNSSMVRVSEFLHWRWMCKQTGIWKYTAEKSDRGGNDEEPIVVS